MIALLSPADVAETLKVSKRTAYKLMQEMAHIERPMRVTEASLTEWINQRAVEPGRKRRSAKRPLVTEWKIERR